MSASDQGDAPDPAEFTVGSMWQFGDDKYLVAKRCWIYLDGPYVGMPTSRPRDTDDGQELILITRQELGAARLMGALDGYTYATTLDVDDLGDPVAPLEGP